MKKILLIAFAFLATSSLFAQDFTAGGINYSVTSTTAPLTVKVAYHSSFTGAANIPSMVTNVGTTYSVTSIGQSAFSGSVGLTSVSIPSSVTSIGGGAFYGCTSLTSVSIPASVSFIASFTFQGCSSLTAVSIPSSVTSIGTQAFSSCTGLTSVGIPNSVTSIGYAAFVDCTSLASVTIPSSVTSIGGYAFNNCTALTSVTINWTTPLAIYASVFDGVTLSNVTLNVPAGTTALYDAAAVWTDFSPITATLSTNNFNANADINLYPNPSNGIFNFQLANDLQIEVYNNLGQLLSSEKMISGTNTINIANQAAGIYFLKANDGNNTSTYKIIKN